MKIAYFASDLSDAATIRRVRILRMGGADVRVLGFRRTPHPIRDIEGVPAIDLGQTFNGKLASRPIQIAQVARKNWRDVITNSDVVFGRNLEMATLADLVRTRSGVRCRLAYECLDIHAAFLGNGIKAKFLKQWERKLLQRCSVLITSSQSYVDNYFSKLEIALPKIVLAENKRVLTNGTRQAAIHKRQPPWRIGWFGGLRCVESFEILLDLAKQLPQHVVVYLRGRIQNATVQAMVEQHLPQANMRYDGPYTEADLETLYNSVDMTWAVEYFGKGGNSDWCLANRIYEGGYYNSLLIAQAGTATGDWLEARDSGVVLSDPPNEIARFLRELTPETYHSLAHAATEVPTDDLVWTEAGCRDFVHQLAA